jgi:hypothetical protein
MLLNRIAKPDLEPQRIIVPTELVTRESCRSIETGTGIEYEDMRFAPAASVSSQKLG